MSMAWLFETGSSTSLRRFPQSTNRIPPGSHVCRSGLSGLRWPCKFPLQWTRGCWSRTGWDAARWGWTSVSPWAA